MLVKSNCDRLKLAIGISAFFPLILLHYMTEARAYGSAYPQYCALKFFSFKTPVIDGCIGKIGAKGSPTWNSVKNSNKTCNAPSASEYDGLFDLGKKREEFTTLPHVLTIKRVGMSFPAKVEVLHPTSRKIIHTTFETEFDHSGTALLNTGVQIGFDIFSKDQLSLSGDFGEMLFSTFCSEQKEIAFNFKGDEEMNSSGGRKNWAKRKDPLTDQKTASKAELEYERKKREKLERELAALKTDKAKEQKAISSDNKKPVISASAKSSGQTNAVVSGKVSDNIEVAEVTVGGEVVSLTGDGSFETSFYIPRAGKTVEIVAFDTKGNKATKSLFLERGAVQGATGPVFASLNPSGKRVKSNKDALALIIGVADYERTPAKAAYADEDAKTFYDYAMLKLGIPAGNITELVNVDANRIDVALAIKDWIARTTKQGSSDIYIFFAGHGLASQSGEQMYLLPYDGSPRLLEDSAISRERLFSDIAAANPRSVTVFLDTCYSGTTRGTDMLIASRPIAIKALEQSIPDNFTVMTAAAGDQTAKPLEEAKHGMFSYFLMKGMEGEADKNQDNKITAGELHSYVQSNVVQQSSGSQTPELQGDAERVLVRFQ